MSELMIVMPVYNEQASIRKVVTEWIGEIRNWTDSFTFLVIDDGSTDDTPAILRELAAQWEGCLEVINQENLGHGQTCLKGYRLACERKIPWLFQIDSDGQCDPQYFFRLWKQRESYDVLYGYRQAREDGWKRTLATFILRAVLLTVAGVWCRDANTPYRLMRTEKLGGEIDKIPDDFHLANIAVAVLLRRAGWKEGGVPIRFRERYGGEPSVGLKQFGEKAWELIRQLRRI